MWGKMGGGRGEFRHMPFKIVSAVYLIDSDHDGVFAERNGAVLNSVDPSGLSRAIIFSSDKFRRFL